jgi:hypothetical protein
VSKFKMFGLALIAVLFVTALIAGPAFAERPAVAAATPEAASADQPGCGETLDLAEMVDKAQVCPAELPQNPVPELKAGRTCRCSCGFPCKTDADCGPGGMCRAGITCC